HLMTSPIGGGAAATIASATTTDLGSVPQSYVTVSGTVTITAFGSSAPTGTIHVVKFSGALLLTHNATSLILPGAANITTVAGDMLFAVHEGSGNWRVLLYQRANASPFAGGVNLVSSPNVTMINGTIVETQ